MAFNPLRLSPFFKNYSVRFFLCPSAVSTLCVLATMFVITITWIMTALHFTAAPCVKSLSVHSVTFQVITSLFNLFDQTPQIHLSPPPLCLLAASRVIATAWALDCSAPLFDPVTSYVTFLCYSVCMGLGYCCRSFMSEPACKRPWDNQG